MAIAASIIVSSPTIVEAVDGRDRNRDNRVVVARPTTVLGDEVDLVPMVAISVANRVTLGKNVFFIRIKDHNCHPEAPIARAGLYPSRVH